ncbi:MULTISPECIES: class I lanthipeptide [Chryseobacterium]|uniref:class I lanthipeptide n=1 Tax=Chryseobacterium TaxID=59732 RepID=UPI00235990BE|nr:MULTISPECIES: class I lanthipeptide [unclassified Chryseobacterium]MDC8106604.1 class I lanthipeptide [Chryseobacterium sp. B21-037]MDQ1806496.1 class I lanthipeptide [Chryseobacterium sp. CKR4-1]
MKKQVSLGKLSLNKEKIAQLSAEGMSNVKGGNFGGSTCAGFTCGWCTSTMDSSTTKPLGPKEEGLEPQG